MTTEDLKPHQRAQLAAIVTRHGIFYERLAKQMERLGFPLADPVYQRAVHARNAIDALRTLIIDIGANAAAPATTPGYLDSKKATGAAELICRIS